MTNIVKVITCYIKIKKSTIDHLLTNKRVSCRMTNITESGLSDCHKLISLFIKSLRQKNLLRMLIKVADFSYPTSSPNDNYLVQSNTDFS